MLDIVTSPENSGKNREVGQKAQNLFLLNKYFPVPEFVAVSTNAFKDYRKYKKITPEFENELRKSLEYFLKKGPVAIRSSATAEDLPGISFAGMYVTALNITDIDDGIKAVIRTWDSVDLKRVKNYCEKMNISTGDMAVIIQHQLNPEVSGVMVTQSPFSVSEMLIECCRGLGDKLVSGQITPERYRIRGNDIIEQRGDNLLSEEQLFELIKAGKKIEKIFKSPQDIEWAIENGKFYVLQSRSVLIHGSLPRRKCTVWCNANVRETIPDPMSPMGWSIFDGIFFPSIFIDVFEIPISPHQYKKFRPVELLSGRLYWNMNNTIAYMKSIGPIVALIEADRAIDPQMAKAFRAVDLRNLPKPIPSFRMFRFSLVALIHLTYYIFLGFFRYRWLFTKITKSYKEYDNIYEQFKPTEDVAKGLDKIKTWFKPAEGLAKGLDNIRTWLRFVLRKFARRYFGGLFLSGFFLALLSKLLSVRMGKKGEAIARKTIIGILDKTGEMAVTMNTLASFAKKKIDKITPENLKKLYKRDKEFNSLFNKFLADFGHRGPAEFDIASPNWREDHHMVYKLIAAAKDSEGHCIDRETMIKDLLKSSRPYEKFILKLFLPRIEVFTPLRENGKHIYIKSMAKLKDQLFIIEKILLKQGYIQHDRDIFFLTLKDLEDIIIRRCERSNILELIRKRKKEWETYRQSKAPDIIYESGERISVPIEKSAILSGEPLSFGVVRAKVRVINDFGESHKLNRGEILVTHHADPGWTPLFTVASGVIIEVGGFICHAAMVARELGIPAVVVRGATSLLHDGQIVELDADEGRVMIISPRTFNKSAGLAFI